MILASVPAITNAASYDWRSVRQYASSCGDAAMSRRWADGADSWNVQMILPRSLVIDCLPGLGEPSTKVKLLAVKSVIIEFGIRRHLGVVLANGGLLPR